MGTSNRRGGRSERRPVVLTGGSTVGHVAGALAVWQALSRTYGVDGDVWFVGEATGPSRGYLDKSGFGGRWVGMRTAKLRTYRSARDLSQPFRLVGSVSRALWFLARHRPALVVSGGGHTAVPVALAAWLLRVPVVAHEQTPVMGLANRVIFRVARVRLASFPPEPGDAGGQAGAVVTGPLVPDPPGGAAGGAALLAALPTGSPLLFVTGGSQGSRAVNEAVWANLDGLASRFVVLHQCGEASLEEARQHRDGLPEDRRPRYEVRDLLGQAEFLAAIAAADVVVGRSGAGTVGSLLTHGAGFAVLVPLPHARGDEQRRLAQLVVDRGTAVIADEPGLPDRLPALVDEALRRRAARTGDGDGDGGDGGGGAGPAWAGDPRVAAVLGGPVGP